MGKIGVEINEQGDTVAVSLGSAGTSVSRETVTELGKGDYQKGLRQLRLIGSQLRFIRPGTRHPRLTELVR